MNYNDLITYVPNKKPPKNFKDLTGLDLEYFKVISRAPNQNNTTSWNVQCKACGNYCVKNASNLKRDKSCGCMKNKNIGAKLRKDLTNQRFGNLTAIKYSGYSNSSRNAIWICQCDCGNYCKVDSNNLTTLHTCSCGCIASSIGVDNIKEILKNASIDYVTEYPVYDIPNEDNSHPYRFDFLLYDTEKQPLRFVEYDGIQHFMETWEKWKSNSTLAEQQERDKAKNKYALSHNIPLVRIPYWERDKITLEMILGDQYLVH